jgi:hypothetical protein
MRQTELTRPGERLDQVANATATVLPARLAAQAVAATA